VNDDMVTPLQSQYAIYVAFHGTVQRVDFRRKLRTFAKRLGMSAGSKNAAGERRSTIASGPIKDS
jgi:acylphosphatase